MFENCFHAPTTLLFTGRDAVLRLAVPDGVRAVEQIALCYTAAAGTFRVRMLPEDGFEGGESYSVYAAAVPAAHLSGETLCYHFETAREHSEEYCVKLAPLPPFPPFEITEALLFNEICTGLELYNPNDYDVDLFDYELSVTAPPYQGEEHLPMAAQAGENVLHAGDMCFFRLIDPKWLNPPNGAEYGTPAGFLAEAARKYPTACGDIAERGVRVLQASCAEWDETAAKWRHRKGMHGLQLAHKSADVAVVPRGKGSEEAVYSFSYSQNGRHDGHRDFAVALRTAAADPTRAVVTDHYAVPTPGFLAEGQPLLDAEDIAPPVIVPLSPAGKVFLSAGDVRITFAVIAAGGCAPCVFLKNNGIFTPFRAIFNTDGVYEVTIPAALVRRAGAELCYYIEAYGGLYTVSCGNAAAPLCVRLVDNAGPDILRAFPAEGQVLENDPTPEIRIDYEDISGVNTHICVLCVDGLNVTAEANFTADRVTYRPKKPLAYGAHTVEVTLRDTLGNRTYRHIAFEIGNGKKLTPYAGQIHSHTNVSDGEGGFEEAYAFARDQSGADFFAATDHSHYIEHTEYPDLVRRAAAFNENGRFAALHGFEVTWTDKNGWWGHMNVLNTDWVEDDPWKTDLPALETRLANDPDAIAMFNHPGAIWGNFNDFAGVSPALAEKVLLSEIKNKAYDRPYALLLARGWRAAPVYNEDNHHRGWANSGAMGYVLAPTLTRENILDGIRRHRTYATCDRTMKLWYRVNGAWLGSTLQAPERLAVEVKITTENVRGIGRIQLVTEDNLVAAACNAGALRQYTWRTTVPADLDYYYIRVENGETYTVTAPVWIEGRNALSVGSVTVGTAAEGPHAVSVSVGNSGTRPMSDVTAAFYLSPRDGFYLPESVPFATVRLGTLAAGETRTVTYPFPDARGARRVTVIARGACGGTRYAATAMALLSPLYITKILPAAAAAEKDGKRVENPYAFVELCNLTDAPLKLRGYALRLWKGVGHAPKPEQTLPLDGITLPPQGTAVLWQRPDAALTAEDFNAHFGTALEEGKTLFLMEKPLLYATEDGQRLDVVQKEEELTFITWGNYCGAPHAMPDVPLSFGIADRETAQQRPLPRAAARPGEVTGEQRPPLLKAVPAAEELPPVPAAKTPSPARPGKVRSATRIAKFFSAFKGMFREKK